MENASIELAIARLVKLSATLWTGCSLGANSVSYRNVAFSFATAGYLLDYLLYFMNIIAISCAL